MAEAQNDPLLPGYSFNAHLVAGLTPIEANGYLDFFIDRPLGMKGYILNLTIRGQGVVKIRDENLSADRVIFCCSRQRDSSLRSSSGGSRMVSPVGLLSSARLLA